MPQLVNRKTVPQLVNRKIVPQLVNRKIVPQLVNRKIFPSRIIRTVPWALIRKLGQELHFLLSTSNGIVCLSDGWYLFDVCYHDVDGRIIGGGSSGDVLD